MPNPLTILIDTAPLATGHALRGIGMYTKLLMSELAKRKNLHLVNASEVADKAYRPDVIHYPFFDLFFATLPWRRIAPTVVTIHDVIPLLFPKQYKPGKKGTVNLWRQRLTLKTVAAIITDSQASKTDIVKYLRVPEHKVQVVYLAANPELAAAGATEVRRVRQLYNLPKTYVLYVGDINYNKNIPQLIKSVKFMPEDVHLVCVGKNFQPQDIPEWQWIETQIALSDVAERVHFVTEIGGEAMADLSAIYTGALAYIQPSLYEGFGLPVLEAMQCRTPVIAARNSSLIEVGGKHAVFVEGEAEAIAEAVKEIQSWSENRRATVLREAFKWSQTFSWAKTAEETIRVYQQVAKQS